MVLNLVEKSALKDVVLSKKEIVSSRIFSERITELSHMQ